jgi:Trk K+ transport system NAD-binding subunit
MTLKATLIGLKIKLKENRWPIFLLFATILFGFIYFYMNEPMEDPVNALLIAMAIRQTSLSTDLAGLYQLVFPILLEVIVFGVLLSVFLEKYNPVATSKILAQNHKNHSVVLGFAHLGERLVDYMIDHKKNYTLVEYDVKKVNDLINSGEPVIVGDFTEEATLEDAGVRDCKEVFCVTDQFRVAIILAKKIRKLNPDCELYFRIYKNKFMEYLKKEPWNAITFSTSKWTMESVRKWASNKTGAAIVLGDDHIARQIVKFMADNQQRQVRYYDPDVDPDDYMGRERITFSQVRIMDLEDIETENHLDEIEQIYVCWRSENTFDKSLLLMMELEEKYPNIEKYIRIYDKETAEIIQQYNATTFSTSSYAFEMLQAEVPKDSNIFPDN